LRQGLTPSGGRLRRGRPEIDEETLHRTYLPVFDWAMNYRRPSEKGFFDYH
jgi:hypothetical protein